MRNVVAVVLGVVALVHVLPVLGVLGAARLAQMYDVPVQDAGVELLLRHRAVLFGLLAAFTGYAALLRPDLHRLALVAGLLSVGSFLVLWWLQQRGSGGLGAALDTVAWVDLGALVLLCGALALDLRRSA